MTSEHNGRDRRLEDELYVDALLAESGFPAASADDGGLRDRLLRLRRLRGAEVPEPCAELAALMGGAGPGLAEVIPLEGRARNFARRRRAVFTSLAVAASLGIAGGAAAGNETVRRHAEGTIETIVRAFAPPAPAGPNDPVPAAPDPAAPAPAASAEAPGPGSGVVLPPAAVVPPGGPAPRASIPGETSARENPGAGTHAASKHAPGPGHAPTPGVPPLNATEQPAPGRPSTRGTVPGAQDQTGTPPPGAERTAAPKPPETTVSRGASPR